MTKQQFTRNAPPEGFYTYAYLRKDGRPFYVGKGSGRRAWEPHGPAGKRWKPPADKNILILKWGIAEPDAFAHERYLIAVLGNHYAQGGILRMNFTEGGEGPSGCVRSEKTRFKMGAWQKGKKRSAHEMRGIQVCADEKKRICAEKYEITLEAYEALAPRQRSNMKRWIRENPGKTGNDYLTVLQRGTDSKTRQAHRAISRLCSLGFSVFEAKRLAKELTAKQREGMYKVARKGKVAEVRNYAVGRGWVAA